MNCRGKNGTCKGKVKEGLYCDDCRPGPPGTLYLQQVTFENLDEPAQDTEDTDHETLK
jgi:hypothetical protein